MRSWNHQNYEQCKDQAKLLLFLAVCRNGFEKSCLN